MSDDSEIPCSACHKWDAAAKSFSCNPHECRKLSEWLLNHAQIDRKETMQFAVVPIQYVV
ncbi:MAG TPA: hypothetical protein VEF91_00315 [Verrucomicrobiae bacterium]|nr:hypothetical protein [Verrucomicrobiae bacterium]